MSWKEFLKPNLWKLIIPLIFTIIPFLELATFSEAYSCHVLGKCGGIITQTFGVTFSDVFGAVFVTLTYPLLTLTNLLNINWFFSTFFIFIYWYLISCLIVWIYKKVRKK